MQKIYLSHKIRLYPNDKQKFELEQACYYNIYCYNKGLEIWNKLYEKRKEDKENNEMPFFNSVSKLMRETKQAWENSYSSLIMENAIKDIESGLHLFLIKKNKHPPKFKSKKKCEENFRYRAKNKYAIQIVDDGYGLKLLKISSVIKMSERVRFKGTIKAVTISKKNEKFYAAFLVELSENPFKKTSSKLSCGVDIGVKTLATICDSNDDFYSFDLPKKKLKEIEKKISFYNTLLSRKTKYSKRFLLARAKLRKYWKQHRDIRRDCINRLTSWLCKRYKTICIEDIKVRNIIKMKSLSKGLFMSSFREIRRELEYKSVFYGNEIVLADCFYPSSQTCSKCGYTRKKEEKMKLKDRTFCCPKCGHKMDRDENASMNLRNYGMQKRLG